jgi:hypothetical protein
MLVVYLVRIWPFIWWLQKSADPLFISTGEDALANLSVERTEAGTIIGHVRIRSKTQGIALSLGDRITMGELLRALFSGGVMLNAFSFSFFLLS